MPTPPVQRRRKLPLLVLLLASTTASAHGWEVQPGLLRPRNLFLSNSPETPVPELFVAGGRVTTLRLPSPCDPGRTTLLGWEGRFEPLLVGGRLVVLAPLQHLAAGERFLLQVTLKDGTVLPFTVTASEDRVDLQVNVFPDPNSPEAVRTALKEQRSENQALLAENLRQRAEATSVDHALAALLVNNELALTPFVENDKWLLHEKEFEVEVIVLVPKGKVATTKTAVVFKVTNKDPARPWDLQEARLTTFRLRKQLPFALRAAPASIAPGKQGRIAVVTDFAAFDSDTDSERLVLELFGTGGRRQVYVELVPQDRR